MYEHFAMLLVLILGVYVALGFLFGIAFITVGVQRVDPVARRTGIGFRLLILPGVAAFWPLLARRWIVGSGEPPAEKEPHR
jgi:hypothetical protein